MTRENNKIFDWSRFVYSTNCPTCYSECFTIPLIPIGNSKWVAINTILHFPELKPKPTIEIAKCVYKYPDSGTYYKPNTLKLDYFLEKDHP